MLKIMILGVFSIILFFVLLWVLFKQQFNLHHYLGMAFVVIAALHAGNELWPFFELKPSMSETLSILFNHEDLLTFSGTLSLLTFVFVLGTSFLKNLAHSKWMIFHRASWLGFLFLAIHVFAAEIEKPEAEFFLNNLLLLVFFIATFAVSGALLFKLYKRHHHRSLSIAMLFIGVGIYSHLSMAAPVILSELQKHSTPNDCWILIEGNVYDITQYISKHPTPDSVLTNLCGKDGTAGWKTKGRKNKSHSKKAEIMLKKLRVGPLTNPN